MMGICCCKNSKEIIEDNKLVAYIDPGNRLAILKSKFAREYHSLWSQWSIKDRQELNEYHHIFYIFSYENFYLSQHELRSLLLNDNYIKRYEIKTSTDLELLNEYFAGMQCSNECEQFMAYNIGDENHRNSYQSLNQIKTERLNINNDKIQNSKHIKAYIIDSHRVLFRQNKYVILTNIAHGKCITLPCMLTFDPLLNIIDKELIKKIFYTGKLYRTYVLPIPRDNIERSFEVIDGMIKKRGRMRPEINLKRPEINLKTVADIHTTNEEIEMLPYPPKPPSLKNYEEQFSSEHNKNLAPIEESDCNDRMTKVIDNFDDIIKEIQSLNN